MGAWTGGVRFARPPATLWDPAGVGCGAGGGAAGVWRPKGPTVPLVARAVGGTVGPLGRTACRREPPGPATLAGRMAGPLGRTMARWAEKPRTTPTPRPAPNVRPSGPNSRPFGPTVCEATRANAAGGSGAVRPPRTSNRSPASTGPKGHLFPQPGPSGRERPPTTCAGPTGQPFLSWLARLGDRLARWVGSRFPVRPCRGIACDPIRMERRAPGQGGQVCPWLAGVREGEPPCEPIPCAWIGRNSSVGVNQDLDPNPIAVLWPRFGEREIPMQSTHLPMGSVCEQPTPSGTARTEPRPPGTMNPGSNAVGGGAGGPLIRAAATFSALGEQDP